MPPSPQQLNLLEWTPPATTVRFEDSAVRGASISASLCKAIATTLREAKLSRDKIAEKMSKWLGSPVPKNMLDAYASEARDRHEINLVRFLALLHATGDRRLLEMLAEPMGWTVIERKHLPLIELAQVQVRRKELGRHADHLLRQAQSKGGL